MLTPELPSSSEEDLAKLRFVVDIAEAAAFLKAEGCERVGTVGFRVGGALALAGLAANMLALGGLAQIADITAGATFGGVDFPLFTAALGNPYFPMGNQFLKPIQGQSHGCDRAGIGISRTV